MKGEHCLVCVVVAGAVATVGLAVVGFIGVCLWWERRRSRFTRGIARHRINLVNKRVQLLRGQRARRVVVLSSASSPASLSSLPVRDVIYDEVDRFERAPEMDFSAKEKESRGSA